MVYKNSEGYADPTAGKAFENIAREEEQRRKAATEIIGLLKSVARVAGFEIVGEITVKDNESGIKFKEDRNNGKNRKTSTWHAASMDKGGRKDY